MSMRRKTFMRLLISDPERAYRALWAREWVREAGELVGVKVTARRAVNQTVFRQISERLRQAGEETCQRLIEGES